MNSKGINPLPIPDPVFNQSIFEPICNLKKRYSNLDSTFYSSVLNNTMNSTHNTSKSNLHHNDLSNIIHENSLMEFAALSSVRGEKRSN